jgi:hypothetical protein
MVMACESSKRNAALVSVKESLMLGQLIPVAEYLRMSTEDRQSASHRHAGDRALATHA